ncbi:MAG: glutamine-hydrolyzing carbamoyl-phosphate synthase small subunit [Planctomycetota bacterium]
MSTPADTHQPMPSPATNGAPSPTARGTARLVLEDGRIFRGTGCGATGTTPGEVVFNTAMTGYQEILTDPSYYGQIVCMTTAEVGVYGINPADVESGRVQVAGFVVRRITHAPSNWRAVKNLPAWLAENGVVAIEDVDTRALTRHLRVRGVMRGVISTDASLSDADLIDRARHSAGVTGQDFTAAVTCSGNSEWSEKLDAAAWFDAARVSVPSSTGSDLHMVVVDYGAKRNIPRHLAARGCRVTVVPASSSAESILALQPDGVMLSNGPGDPAACEDAIAQIRKLVGKVPIGAICLGFQMCAIACGALTEKLPFGHRGANHPVRVIESGRVLVASMNHGFAVRRDTLRQAGLRMTHLSLNDGTVQGYVHEQHPVLAVQYHPEASPGPHDAHDEFFDRLVAMVREHKKVHAPAV